MFVVWWLGSFWVVEFVNCERREGFLFLGSFVRLFVVWKLVILLRSSRTLLWWTVPNVYYCRGQIAWEVLLARKPVGRNLLLFLSFLFPTHDRQIIRMSGRRILSYYNLLSKICTVAGGGVCSLVRATSILALNGLSDCLLFKPWALSLPRA